MSGMHTSSKVYVAGHRGMVGSAIVRRLQSDGYGNLVLRTRQELDLTDQHAVENFFASEHVEYVFLAAAKVGGIHANSAYPAEFIRDNLAIQTNVIHSAWKHGAKKLLYLGSSCIYPRDCQQPIKERYLLTGPLEPSNAAYAIAKIAGLTMCQAYRNQYGFDAIVAMPTNLYGPGDNYHPENSHVVAALISRFHDAKVRGDDEVVIWGTGKPLRELLHVDDLADALLLLMRRYSDASMVNVGSDQETSIVDLASKIARITGFRGRWVFDPTRPDGTPRKRLDPSKMRAMGWTPRFGLEDGLRDTYAQFIANNSPESSDA
jgi:GDP-L-fucose synthase